MAFHHPSTSNTLIISLFLWITIFALFQINSSFFRANEIRTILGGVVGALLFFFTITFIGSIKREVKWIETIFSLLMTFFVSSSVHAVSGTTSVLFSIGILFYMNFVSKRIYERDEAAAAVTTGGKKKTTHK
ncbi:hypothetical protein DLAC_01171 [Tieghemostelium lacteum]|uniref:Uncharacterized protein n=1 Tax=Tieghemostelium lacteum TaxID=361077 RepID=A0A152A872_TIELA|nr:hypothetical protein DLAC_01171 [Tieghemostelium lacteum]|eukprot:KYR02341.1 hypothetical protein DLAC_01171 [Tieghemostelium lacteum]